MSSPPSHDVGLEQRWRALDTVVRTWWDADRATATPQDVAADDTGTLLPLPRPYSTAGGTESAFPEMYGWDSHFINLGMLVHGRTDLVADHLVNHLYMVEQYGMVLNGNRTYYLTRSQPPLLADSLERYLTAVVDDDMAELGLRLLAAEHDGYWSAEHHATSTGLTTNRDLGDPRLRAELAAEAETGLDFTAVYGGDVRRCVPLLTNACLVRTADVLAGLAVRLGRDEDANHWSDRSRERAARVRSLCWDDDTAFFLEVDVVSGRRLPWLSLSAFWVMWAGIATERQADALVTRLAGFRGRYGVAFTDRPYPSPHPEFGHLQWQHPAGWPPMQVIVVQALQRYGYDDLARAIARDFVELQVLEYERTGSLWEKYDVVSGGVDLPVERYPAVPMHGWSSASVAVLGAVAFDGHDSSSADLAPRSEGAQR